jgi:hypothetical protein
LSDLGLSDLGFSSMVKGLVELSNHLPDARRQLASLTVQCLLGVAAALHNTSHAVSSVAFTLKVA